MQDYTLIENTWKDSLIKFSVPASLETLNLSQENKNLLEYVGLPLIHSSHSERLLPFTFFPSTTVQGKDFYLLGDIGSVTMGINFIGLEKKSGKIFSIWIHNKDDKSCSFINQSLYKYLLCLAHYTNFFDHNYTPLTTTKAQVRADYQMLKENMTQADTLAMADRSCFWADLVYCIQVGGLGDYFSDFDYEDTEPLTPEEQKRIDNMDLPF